MSIRKDIASVFEFPQKQELKLKLKDMLEDEVDEKYYLSENMKKYMFGVNQKQSKFPRKERFLSNVNRQNQNIANSITTNAGNRPTDNFVIKNKRLLETLVQNENELKESSYIDSYNKSINNSGISGTITTRVSSSNMTHIINNLRIRKFTPKEIWRLMGFDDEDFDKAAKVNSNSQLYKQARKFDCSKCARRNI